MNRKTILLCGFLLTALVGGAQELKMTGSALLTQVFGESVESDEPLPMNDLGMEFGYVLYEAEVTLSGGDAELSWRTCGTMPRCISTGSSGDDDGPPENADAACRSGLSCAATLCGEYRPHHLRSGDPRQFEGAVRQRPSRRRRGRRLEDHAARSPRCRHGVARFRPSGALQRSCFRRGYFDCAAGNGVYLDVSGWGMGEVWINGRYLGAFWDEEKQQSIRFRTTFWKRKETGSSFSISGTTIRMRRCVFRTNPCSNNQYE